MLMGLLLHVSVLTSLGVHGFYFDLLLRVVSAMISYLCLCFCCFFGCL